MEFLEKARSEFDLKYNGESNMASFKPEGAPSESMEAVS
jgi:hypothetical protein